MNVTCDICEATIEVLHPVEWKDWMQSHGPRDSQGRRLAEVSAKWMVLSGGRWTRDKVVCGNSCWETAARYHTPERMREAGYELGSYIQFFYPEAGVLPEWMIERGGWPPTKNPPIIISNRYLFLGGFLSAKDVYSSGINDQIHRAIQQATRLTEAGWLVWMPHLNLFWNMVTPKPPEFWEALSKAWMRQCAAYVCTGTNSSSLEREWARQLGIPFFESVNEFVDSDVRVDPAEDFNLFGGP